MINLKLYSGLFQSMVVRTNVDQYSCIFWMLHYFSVCQSLNEPNDVKFIASSEQRVDIVMKPLEFDISHNYKN